MEDAVEGVPTARRPDFSRLIRISRANQLSIKPNADANPRNRDCPATGLESTAETTQSSAMLPPRILVPLLCASFSACAAAADSDAQALASKFLAALNSERASIAARLADYSGPIAPVIDALANAEPRDWKEASGALFDEHFSAPILRRQYPDDLLNFYIPDDYSPDRPFGLMIFMHGGGPGTKREYARVIGSDPAKDKYSYDIPRYFRDAPFILVGPSALVNEKSSARWNLPEADEHIAAVIRECHFRFNIDRDRIFLGGQSMGGFGAYHLCQRLSDRLAGGALHAGAWRVSHWKNVIGASLFIRHGAHDAVAPGARGKSARPRYTDIFFARSAHRALTEAGADHVYAEDSGGHSIKEAGNAMKQMVEWMKPLRRDPHFPRVVALTPRGWDAPHDTPTPHHRWITIQEIGDGAIPFDAVQRTGPGPAWTESRESFDKQGFKMTKRNVRAGLVDATNHGDNSMTITTDNVIRFSVWLHPKMADFSKPLRITVNGRASAHAISPSLLTALRSYERRRDWGLIYHAEIELAP